LFGLVKRYPYRLARYYTPLDAALDHFLRLHETLGVSRDALTQPSVLGTHNAALVEAVARHPERLWAVVALGTDVTEQTNYVMHAGRAQARVVGLRLAVCNVPHRDA
jgi:2-pyrone-4,6-dicarboxylate lactonase